MPVNKYVQRAGLAAIILVALSGFFGGAMAAPAGAETAPTIEWRSAVQTGARMEQSRDWLKAIEHYEQALKAWPENEQLQYGLRRSKVHFAIDRRYSDNSFEQRLLHKSRSECLEVFDDVLSQVRGNYVTPISSTTFVAHGTESLSLALVNPKFVARNLRNAGPERIERMRALLKEQYWNKPISQSSGARQVVEQVCSAAKSLLNLSDSAVVMEYVFGGCNALDDYSSFLTPDRLDDLYGNIEGEFVGLGIEMKSEPGTGLLLVNVLPESPAAEGGMRRGDHVVEIDGVDCRNMNTDEAAKLLRGRAGSHVRLTYLVMGDDKERRSDFVRRAVTVKSIPIAKIIDRGNGIAYIKMVGFQKTTPAELDEALKKLHGQGMRSLVWDLRDNPGGLLNAAAEVLDRFIADGVLVSTRGRTRDQNTTYSAYRQGTWNLPLVLLVDGNSASASEIVAGAVHDHKRGTIVGRTTYGKWSVQTVFQVRNQSGLRLTTAKFYSPNGKNLAKVGVEPDVPVELPQEHITFFRGAPDDVDTEHDPDLKQAVSILGRQFTQR
jgi:carboxyl-terminal processing protease